MCLEERPRGVVMYFIRQTREDRSINIVKMSTTTYWEMLYYITETSTMTYHQSVIVDIFYVIKPYKIPPPSLYNKIFAMHYVWKDTFKNMINKILQTNSHILTLKYLFYIDQKQNLLHQDT